MRTNNELPVKDDDTDYSDYSSEVTTEPSYPEVPDLEKTTHLVTLHGWVMYYVKIYGEPIIAVVFVAGIVGLIVFLIYNHFRGKQRSTTNESQGVSYIAVQTSVTIEDNQTGNRGQDTARPSPKSATLKSRRVTASRKSKKSK